jgi:hypothetical protein
MAGLHRFHHLLKFEDLFWARAKRAAQATHRAGPNAGPAMLDPINGRNPYSGV